MVKVSVLEANLTMCVGEEMLFSATMDQAYTDISVA